MSASGSRSAAALPVHGQGHEPPAAHLPALDVTDPFAARVRDGFTPRPLCRERAERVESIAATAIFASALERRARGRVLLLHVLGLPLSALLLLPFEFDLARRVRLGALAFPLRPPPVLQLTKRLTVRFAPRLGGATTRLERRPILRLIAFACVVPMSDGQRCRDYDKRPSREPPCRWGFHRSPSVPTAVKAVSSSIECARKR